MILSDEHEHVFRRMRTIKYNKLRMLERHGLFTPAQTRLREEIEALSVVLDTSFHEWAKGKPKHE